MTVPGAGASHDWRQIAQPSINSIVDNPVEVVRFDPFEELFWVGSSNGKVSGFLPMNQCSRYSAFVVSKLSGVHAIEPTEHVVFSVGDTMLRATTRQGIPLAKYSSPSFERLTASCVLHNTNNTLVLGGRQSRLVQWDFAKECEVRTVEASQPSLMIKYNGTSVFTADDHGNVHVKSAKTFETVHTLNCHGGRILDFDVQGNKLISCGISQNRLKNTDTFMKVYDLRMYRAMAPIPSPLPPRFVRFMPSYCERVAMVYQMHANSTSEMTWIKPAAVRMFDLNSQGNAADLFTDVAQITSFDFSSTKRLIALGTHVGIIQLFSDSDQPPMVNEASKPSMFAAPPAQPPCNFPIDDFSQSLATIPLPFPQDQRPYVSDWPLELARIMYRRTKPPVEHKVVKIMHYAKQVENPRSHTKLKKHNIVPYILEPEEPMIEECSPVDLLEPLAIESPPRIRVSKLYKKRVPPTKSLNVYSSDEETYQWNVTNRLVLQSTFAMNLLANPLVHLIYSLSPLRNSVFRHICDRDSCITCELHFLFAGLQTKPKDGAATLNFAWALARNGVSLQNGSLLDAMHHIVLTTLDDVARKSPEAMSTSSRLERHLKCVRCGALQTVLTETEHLISLDYTAIRKASFCQLIEKAVHLNVTIGTTDEEGGGGGEGARVCEDCGHTSGMECRRKVRELSNVLLIDTNASAPAFLDFWRRQLWTFERRPTDPKRVQPEDPESPSERKSCRFGVDCRKQTTCKFRHATKVDWPSEQAKLLEDVDAEGWRHFIPARIAAQVCEGQLRLTDISDLPDYDEPSAVIYELDAMVDVIGNGEHAVKWTHPVALVRESPVPSTEWTLLNEQLVSRLHGNEARHVDARWKLPVVLAYKRKGFEMAASEPKIPEHYFFIDENLAANGVITPRAVEELPAEGQLVGLDAEFIKIQTGLLEFGGRKVTMRAVGRASCVTREERIIFDDHIRLPDDVDPVDYLTPFSGIVAADLNVNETDKFLSSHKRMLLRMLVLIQRGVTFVGHALHNDFSVMNLHVAEPQIMDTVFLFRMDSQRMLSLRILAQELLGDVIQQGTHDSVVDARYALRVYHKYLELKERQQLNSEIHRIYAIPASSCPSPNPMASPLVISTRRTMRDTNVSGSAPSSM
ncbi:unnamed protein product [Caenorhabditis sp. 36 PRJEB53466]|nr:unnamed protein product [Caenorhabditis sp. 36 PRJEB53466]